MDDPSGECPVRLPTGESLKSLPCLVKLNIHGGPWMGSEGFLRFVGESLEKKTANLLGIRIVCQVAFSKIAEDIV